MPKQSDPDRLYDLNFAIVMVGQTLFVLANTLMTHYNRWIEFLGGDVASVGAIMGSGTAIGLLFRPWIAQWINRLGSRTMWIIGYSLYAVAVLGNLMIHELGPGIYVLRACHMVGLAIATVAGLTYVTQMYPPHRRAEVIGTFGAGGFLGMLVGPLTGDILVGSSERSAGNFGWLFGVTAAMILLALGTLFLQRVPAADARTSARVGLADFVRTCWKYWPGGILLINLAFGACTTVPFVFLATYVDARELAWGRLSIIGMFFWVYAGWGLVVRLGLRRPDRIGRRKLLCCGLVAMALGMFAYLPVTSDRVWLLAIPALLTGTGHALIYPTMTALTLESFPNRVRGTGSSLSLIVFELGHSCGALVLGRVANIMGFGWLFVILGIIAIAAALLWLLPWRVAESDFAKPQSDPAMEVLSEVP